MRGKRDIVSVYLGVWLGQVYHSRLVEVRFSGHPVGFFEFDPTKKALGKISRRYQISVGFNHGANAAISNAAIHARHHGVSEKNEDFHWPRGLKTQTKRMRKVAQMAVDKWITRERATEELLEEGAA